MSFLSQKLHDYREGERTLKLRFLSQKLHECRLTTVLNVLKNKVIMAMLKTFSRQSCYIFMVSPFL
ncbi:hypothetical protein AAZX31_15G213300 [Glycine max]